MSLKIAIYKEFKFTVIETSEGHAQIYQDAKGYFGATWLSVNTLPEGEEALLGIINKEFGRKFKLGAGRIILE